MINVDVNVGGFLSDNMQNCSEGDMAARLS